MKEARQMYIFTVTAGKSGGWQSEREELQNGHEENFWGEGMFAILFVVLFFESIC